ncbi:hypothetical protein G6F31_016765 [Rhizopus arrhizus]|nr:hypothetical protein G6F31_016765 [Rhizopus arrhizus]
MAQADAAAVRIDLGRITALVGDRIAQTSQIDQCGLAEDVMADHAGREPREIEVATALDQLLQRITERGRIAATHQVLGQHARGVRQGGIGAGLDRIDGGTRVEIIQRAAGKGLAAGRMDTAGGSDALVDGDEVAVFRADVVGARADDLAVDALLDDVRAPAGGAGDHEQGGSGTSS